MTKISDLGTSSSCPVSDSLSIIRQTQVQLHALTDVITTTNVLTTRIELCDVLLGEISGIRSSLAKDLQRTRERGGSSGQVNRSPSRSQRGSLSSSIILGKRPGTRVRRQARPPLALI